MSTLGKLATLVRSKNAGPFWITYDILFDEVETYQKVVESGIITKDMMSRTLGYDKDKIILVTLDAAKAIKISIPRWFPQGDLGERDMYSGQQYAPLLAIEIP